MACRRSWWRIPKGGSGKTTLATNIAGWLAGKRQRVGLLDADPQGSSTQWLSRRPALFPPIAGFARRRGQEGDERRRREWLVVDSAAGPARRRPARGVRRADAMVVPVSPSAFDMVATAQLPAGGRRAQGRARAAACRWAGGDARRRAHARSGRARRVPGGFGFPLVTHLRDTQVYVYCARDGYSVFDLPRSRGEQDWEQWKPLTRWVRRHAAVTQGARS